jgi:chemotaxis protein methyltransferase CheR
MQWRGFRKVRGQVCKRINARLRELGPPDFEAYRSYLEDNNDEWAVLDSFCRITISRFFRDREVFRFLEGEVIPKLSEAALFQGHNELRCWSIGCAFGEEPYTLALLWDLAVGRLFPSLKLRILATDADRTMIERAEEGCYAPHSLKDLPLDWIARAFERKGSRFCITADVRAAVAFVTQDVRTQTPHGLFHLILCRNLAFTYFDDALQRETLARLRDKLHAGGILVIGIKESLPPGFAGFTPWPGSRGVYRKDW